MKKILFFSLIVMIISGCIQQQKEIVDNSIVNKNTQETKITINTDWLINKLTQNFDKHNFIVQETASQELGYPETKALGFNNSGVSVLIFDQNHEVYGNKNEFEEAISRYSTDEYYGEIMLQKKQLNSDVLLQYTKSEVMANHGSM